MGWINYHENGRQTDWHLPTQDVVAKRFAEAHAGRLRFCHDARAWFAWDGARWRRDGTGEVTHRIRATAREMAADPFGKPGAMAGNTRFIAGVERFARGEPALAVTAEAWDSDPFLLGTPAGPVDLRTGAWVPADPLDGVRQATAVAPRAASDAAMEAGSGEAAPDETSPG